MPEVRNMGSTTIVRSEPLVSAREEAVRPRREEVREQLGRLLANPLFQHSKHYPGFLRYVVNETLEGRGGPCSSCWPVFASRSKSSWRSSEFRATRHKRPPYALLRGVSVTGSSWRKSRRASAWWTICPGWRPSGWREFSFSSC